MKPLAFASTCALVLLSTTATAEERPTFGPVGPWAMEYADQSCRLIRNFSDGREQITVAFERFQLGVDLRIGLAGSAAEPRRGASEIEFRYLPDDVRRKSPIYQTRLADDRPSILIPSATFLSEPEVERLLTEDGDKPTWPWSAFLEADEQAAARIHALTIDRGLKTALEIRLGPLDEPFKAMRACIDDLVRSWGVDPQRYVLSTRGPIPVGNPARWLRTEDYPREMLRASKYGIVGLRLVVGEDGKAVSCHIEVDAMGPFDDVVCRALLERARFEPALDADGKPMRSYWSTKVNFQLYG